MPQVRRMPLSPCPLENAGVHTNKKKRTNATAGSRHDCFHPLLHPRNLNVHRNPAKDSRAVHVYRWADWFFCRLFACLPAVVGTARWACAKLSALTQYRDRVYFFQRTSASVHTIPTHRSAHAAAPSTPCSSPWISRRLGVFAFPHMTAPADHGIPGTAAT